MMKKKAVVRKTRGEEAHEAIARHTAVAAAAAAAATADEDIFACVICCEKFDDFKRLASIGPCNHPGVCSLCYLRLRKLMKEFSCVLCKTPMEQVMVCNISEVKPFSEFSIWGNDAGPDFMWDDSARMFLPRVYQDQFVLHLDKFICDVMDCPEKIYPSKPSFDTHLREAHKLQLCRVCLTHKKVFLSEQKRFTAQELDIHIRTGDARLGFFGHPRCEFCRTLFYDKSSLFDHLMKNHFNCHICEKEGKSHKYYRNYADLEAHFRNDHFLCEDPDCLAKKFTVFSNHIDLKGHILSMHPGVSVPRTIAVNFTIRRSNRDGSGQAFGSVPNHVENENDVIHEWVYSGPSGAEESAERQRQEAENFPVLAEGAARQMAGWVRASGGGVIPPRHEDFPSLSGSGSHRNQQITQGGHFRAAVAAYPTPAMIAASDEDPWSYPELPTQPTQQSYPTRFGNVKVKVEKPKKKIKAPVLSTENSAIKQQSSIKNSPSEEKAALKKDEPKDLTKVLDTLRALLGDEKFEELKTLSGNYRLGQITAPRYFLLAAAMLPPPQPFIELFEPLVASLPNIALQESLAPLIAAEKQARSDGRSAAPSKAKPPSTMPSVVTQPKNVPNPPQADTSTAISSWATLGSSQGSSMPRREFEKQRNPPSLSKEEFPGLTLSSGAATRGVHPSMKSRPGSGATWTSELKSLGTSSKVGRTGLGVVKLSRESAAVANAKLVVEPRNDSTLSGLPQRPGPSVTPLSNENVPRWGGVVENRVQNLGNLDSQSDFPGLPDTSSTRPGFEHVDWSGTSNRAELNLAGRSNESGPKEKRKPEKKNGSLQDLAMNFK